MWVLESYVVHHLNGTGLHFAQPTCVVHHDAQAGPMSVRCKYSIFVVDNEHANQGSQCSFVPAYTLAVHNVTLYLLGGAQLRP